MLLIFNAVLQMQAQSSAHAHGANLLPPTTFKNPIISGYHPDPSICRVGEDYYLVNSTFEWFPGMPIHHSKDLVNWELVGDGLSRPEQLRLQEGLGDYMGIVAVTIRYHEGFCFISLRPVFSVRKAAIFI